MKSSRYIRNYIADHDLNIQTISQDTQISTHKLTTDCQQPFNATEFLVLCIYLHLKPEQIFSEIN